MGAPERPELCLGLIGLGVVVDPLVLGLTDLSQQGSVLLPTLFTVRSEPDLWP